MRFSPNFPHGLFTALVALAALSFPTALASENLFPENRGHIVEQSQFARRQLKIGGWAFRSFRSCPKDSITCDDARGSNACCPADTVCMVENISIRSHVACCPKDMPNCVDLIRTSPLCADPGLVLWTWKYDWYEHWCCREGETGYVQSTNGGAPRAGACAPEGLQITGTVLGKKATSAAITGAPAGAADGDNTVNPTDASDDGGSDLSSAGDGNSGDGSKTNVGTIVGAVVGSVVGVAIIAGLAFMYLRQRRRADALAAAMASQQGAAGHYAPNAEGKPGFYGPQVQPPNDPQSPHSMGGHASAPSPAPPLYPQNAHQLDSTPIQNRPVPEEATELDSGQYHNVGAHHGQGSTRF